MENHDRNFLPIQYHRAADENEPHPPPYLFAPTCNRNAASTAAKRETPETPSRSLVYEHDFHRVLLKRLDNLQIGGPFTGNENVNFIQIA